ncbi:hypothetical protein JOB18_003780 [Solea senegalensis]|uniref:Uncharacterized protein n=1 Tax=Solea senegalensis TaxID=28829 RepID=A0AAV6Q0G2_SOLSE|nr:hypothetical protein JOB18_003780 [Solea senegalensis]
MAAEDTNTAGSGVTPTCPNGKTSCHLLRQDHGQDRTGPRHEFNMATRWGICGAGKISHDFTVALKTLSAEEHQVSAGSERGVTSVHCSRC